MSEIGLLGIPKFLVRCRGCGLSFSRKEWSGHRDHCIACTVCGHSVVCKVAGCECCESAP